jgi:ferric-dicitrate binding protein FerR (iron transport regulator)
MPTDQWVQIRASDQEREWTVSRLREAYAVGRLDRDELEERSEAAYLARTWGRLSDLTADLPVAFTGPEGPRDTVSQRRMAERRSRLQALACVAGVLCLLVATAVHLPLAGVLLALLMLGAGHR